MHSNAKSKLKPCICLFGRFVSGWRVRNPQIVTWLHKLSEPSLEAKQGIPYDEVSIYRRRLYDLERTVWGAFIFSTADIHARNAS